jgi:dienelactone hydrolase
MRNVAHAGRFLACCLVLVAVCTSAQAALPAETGFVSRTFEDADGVHRYAVYVPKNYSADTKWPVVLYLHGAGFSGTDGQRQLNAGLAAVIRAEGDFPAIAVFPQSEDLDSPLLSRWLAESPDGKRALRILQSVEQEFSIDSSRRVLAGWSMGGYGAWSLAAAGQWSAVIPVSGGGRPELAAQIKAPVWAIHGAIDRAIPSEQSRHMVDAVNAAGGRAVLTEIPHVAHDAWRYALSAPAVREWMFSPHPGAPDTTSLLQQASDFAEQGLADALDGEFKPVLTMPRAISIRMGGDALQTLAFGVPAAVDPSMLKGKIDDLKFDFTAAGEKFQITQSDLTYDVNLHRVLIDTQADGTLRLRVGLNPLTIVVGSTTVRGETHSAEADRFEIRLGPHYPIWIDLVVRPTVADGRMRLRTQSIGFDIPDSNWVITSPENVTAVGADLTPDLVRIALVGGMYMRRSRVEQCVRDFLPALVQKLEDRLQPTSVDRIVAGVWPLAVFRPRLRILPEEVSVDADGLSLVLGLAAASSSEALRAAKPVVTPRWALGPSMSRVRDRLRWQLRPVCCSSCPE